VRAKWEVDVEQDREVMEELCWKPYGWQVLDKLHHWAWKIGGRRLHDWLISRKWYKAWADRKDIYDDSWKVKQTKDLSSAIDERIIEEIELKMSRGRVDS